MDRSLLCDLEQSLQRDLKMDNSGVDVLVLSENFGAGHIKAAEALTSAIRQTHPHISVQHVELGKALRPQVNQAFVQSYFQMLKHAPGLWKKMYARHHDRYFPRWITWCIRQVLYSRLSDWILMYRPKLVVSTHPFTSMAVARLKKQEFPVKLITLITDFSAHGAWIHPEVDRYLVPSMNVQNQMVQLGVPARKIWVTGIPTHHSFWEPKDKEQIRNKLNLRDLPTLFILNGGWGLGETDKLAQMVAKWRDKLQVVIGTGQNSKLHDTLSQISELQHPNILVQGYIQEMSDWMEAADVILTKPGAITCTEAIVKETPLWLYGSIPGHEENNRHFLVSNHLAIHITSEWELDRFIQYLIKKPNAFLSYQVKMKLWRQKIHPSNSVGAILDML
jgi:processive 1,2-diacylglycerol beta-glucosyltransferase